MSSKKFNRPIKEDVMRFLIGVLMLTVLPFAASAFTGEGRYKIVAKPSSEAGIYMVDTKTGKVRFCKLLRDKTFECYPFSE